MIKINIGHQIDLLIVIGIPSQNNYKKEEEEDDQDF